MITTAVVPRVYRSLSPCPLLSALNCSTHFPATKQIGKWALTRVFRGCHELETVSLARCPKLGDEELKEIGARCRKLVKLNLRDCNQVRDIVHICISLVPVQSEIISRTDGSGSVAVGDVRLPPFFSWHTYFCGSEIMCSCPRTDRQQRKCASPIARGTVAFPEKENGRKMNKNITGRVRAW